MKKEQFVWIFILYALLFAAGHWPVWREAAAALRAGAGNAHSAAWAQGRLQNPGFAPEGAVDQEEVEKTRS